MAFIGPWTIDISLPHLWLAVCVSRNGATSLFCGKIFCGTFFGTTVHTIPYHTIQLDAATGTIPYGIVLNLGLLVKVGVDG
jgi:hypothetical protein